ncbi:MAG: hypothetical protein ACI8X5_002991 [Planctomycetota bacterium]|jgi:uncharacterized protein YprB with RNaseH-like and TPR domain
MSLRDRLRRLRREEEPKEPSILPTAAEAIERTSGRPVELEPYAGDLGAWLARRTWFDPDARHGNYNLSEIESAMLEDFILLTGDSGLSALDLKDAVYLDTETTGLSGGAGTYVFMIGLGRFEESEKGAGFECWQGFLDGPGDEPALLEECARRIRESSGVVSFFGKSFDRHRLEDKMRLCGVEPPFADLPHLDLYHPCRRLYRGAYENGRLKTMEQELCGVQRTDDLPGSQAPAAWFDYLAERPHQLEAVFRHNLDDVLSLVSLAAHLGRSQKEERLDGRQLSGDSVCRALGLSRSLADLGEREGALAWIDLAIERGASPRRAIELERAHLLRLSGQAPAAILAYRELVCGSEDACSVPALLELAKLLEHHEHQNAAALECCLTAHVLLKRNHTGKEFARLSRDLEKRTARLRLKSP